MADVTPSGEPKCVNDFNCGPVVALLYRYGQKLDKPWRCQKCIDNNKEFFDKYGYSLVPFHINSAPSPALAKPPCSCTMTTLMSVGCKCGGV